MSRPTASALQTPPSYRFDLAPVRHVLWALITHSDRHAVAHRGRVISAGEESMPLSKEDRVRELAQLVGIPIIESEIG
jgi:hypothetical protein